MKTTLRLAAVGMLVGFVGTVAAAGDPAAGEQKANACAGCHGKTGISSSPQNPNIAGQHEQALYDSMIAYKEGKRDHPAMKAFIAPLSDQDIADLAAFYASQPCK
ncbi:MAG: cytochrome c [Gammaproteobacteria bacterium]|nr:cytochrome c [Gammaproteobacteria bacterium]